MALNLALIKGVGNLSLNDYNQQIHTCIRIDTHIYNYIGVRTYVCKYVLIFKKEIQKHKYQMSAKID